MLSSTGRFWASHRAYRCARHLLSAAGLAVPSAPQVDDQGQQLLLQQQQQQMLLQSLQSLQKPPTPPDRRAKERLDEARRIDEMLTSLQSARIVDAQKIEELQSQLVRVRVHAVPLANRCSCFFGAVWVG